MQYQGKEIEILSKQTIFGKTIAEVRLLTDGSILSVPFSDLLEETKIPPVSSLVFRAIAAKIRSELYNQALLAPLESNIIPLPHQILALEKVMAGQFLRFLMADEVGMGKTIEAGLVLKELKLKGVVKRTLVIVTKTAMLQWQQEMKRHFNETFHLYDTNYINTLSKTFTRLDPDNEINLFTQHNQIIVSMDSLKPVEYRAGWSREKVEEYNRYRIKSVLEADFDLLIIDECHKVGGSDEQVGRFRMADVLCNAIPNILLLSATPHRGKSDHFRRILQLLDADAFIGEGAPSIPELEPYVVRTEKRQAIDYDGKPLFNKRFTHKAEVTYDALKHHKQQKLYASVTDYVVHGFNLAQQSKDNSYGFVMLLFQRMMSSSTQAILEAMQKRAERLTGENIQAENELLQNNLEELGYEGQLDETYEQEIFSLVEETQARYDTELSILRDLIRDARECLETETDAKVEFLLQKLTELRYSGNNLDVKFLIFTEFTATQRMLKKLLSEQGGFLCETIDGSMDFDQRNNALCRFREDVQILISTDAAGESLNMQFAHIVINYDMPWNPMVLEQRIGRVDRIGQQHEVTAINMMLDNSVDKRVYEVVEIKLNNILYELGIDKTSDVLDSTLEPNTLNRLYLTSLLNPARFEQESANWLEEIKQKLLKYRSTEGSLPTLSSSDIKVEKVDEIKYSPLPVWLEKLTRNYLRSKSVPFQQVTDGLQFRFPGFSENIYTFNIRESINNPIPEPLSLQHEIVQSIINEAVPFTPSQLIPVVEIRQGRSVNGCWSLWRLEVKNSFEAQNLILPVFISDEGLSFPAYAHDIWNKIVQEEHYLFCNHALDQNKSRLIYEKIYARAEEILLPRYQETELKIKDNTHRLMTNKEKSFDFQERQIRRIGIENIRKSRLGKLQKEREEWQNSFSLMKQIVPSLQCLMLLKIAHA
jgi:SNF2 family DNA or RNA helicase